MNHAGLREQLFLIALRVEWAFKTLPSTLAFFENSTIDLILNYLFVFEIPSYVFTLPKVIFYTIIDSQEGLRENTSYSRIQLTFHCNHFVANFKSSFQNSPTKGCKQRL